MSPHQAMPALSLPVRVRARLSSQRRKLKPIAWGLHDLLILGGPWFPFQLLYPPPRVHGPDRQAALHLLRLPAFQGNGTCPGHKHVVAVQSWLRARHCPIPTGTGELGNPAGPIPQMVPRNSGSVIQPCGPPGTRVGLCTLAHVPPTCGDAGLAVVPEDVPAGTGAHHGALLLPAELLTVPVIHAAEFPRGCTRRMGALRTAQGS